MSYTQTPHATHNPSPNPLTEFNGETQTVEYYNPSYYPHSQANSRPHSYNLREPAPSRYPAPTSSAMYAPTQWYEQAPTAPPNQCQQPTVFEPQHHQNTPSGHHAPLGYNSEYDLHQLRSWYPMPTHEPVPYPPSMADTYNAWLPDPSPLTSGPQCGGAAPVESAMMPNTWDVALPSPSPMVSNPETVYNRPDLHAHPQQRFFDFPNMLDDGDAVLSSAGGQVGSLFDGTVAWEGDAGQGLGMGC